MTAPITDPAAIEAELRLFLEDADGWLNGVAPDGMAFAVRPASTAEAGNVAVPWYFYRRHLDPEIPLEAVEHSDDWPRTVPMTWLVELLLAHGGLMPIGIMHIVPERIRRAKTPPAGGAL